MGLIDKNDNGGSSFEISVVLFLHGRYMHEMKFPVSDHSLSKMKEK